MRSCGAPAGPTPPRELEQRPRDLEQTANRRQRRGPEHAHRGPSYDEAEQLKRKACSAGVLDYAEIGGENHSRILDAAISRQVTNSNSAALPSSVTLRARLKAAMI